MSLKLGHHRYTIVISSNVFFFLKKQLKHPATLSSTGTTL